jgi:hypothetical protein
MINGEIPNKQITIKYQHNHILDFQYTKNANVVHLKSTKIVVSKSIIKNCHHLAIVDRLILFLQFFQFYNIKSTKFFIRSRSFLILSYTSNDVTASPLKISIMQERRIRCLVTEPSNISNDFNADYALFIRDALNRK